MKECGDSKEDQKSKIESEIEERKEETARPTK